MPRFRAALPLLAIVLAGRPAWAQLRLDVVGTDRMPVAAAQVELWSPTARKAARVSDDSGRVTFRLAETNGATAVLVRRIGYEPRRVPLGEGVVELEVQLQALAASLPAVTIAAAERACPQPESDQARARWEGSRRLYDSASTLGRTSALKEAEGDIEESELGDVEQMRLTTGARGTTTAGLTGEHDAIAAHGYAWPLHGRHFFREYGLWEYPKLEADYAAHFADPLFGARHSFTILDSGASTGETVLQFCPRDRRRSGLEGTLRIASDGSFIAARWRFWNPKRNGETAGGEVVFAPRPVDERAPELLAASGLFWRRLPSGLYYQRWQQYERWILTAGDTLARPSGEP